MSSTDPHANGKIVTAGPRPEEARGALILVHGRGATAESMLSLAPELGVADVAVLAPQAAGHTWYPQSFLAPLDANQPYLDSALRRLDGIVTGLLARGVAGERIVIAGFSQGACLSSEYVARHAREYAALLVLTGGVIGPPGTPRDYAGSLAGTEIFLGSGDPDPHVPFARVSETGAVFERMGATVDVRRYLGRPHTVSEDEIDACRAILERRLG